MKYIAILLALLILGAVYYIVRQRKMNTSSNPLGARSSNVISMDRHRKAKQNPGSRYAHLVRKRMES